MMADTSGQTSICELMRVWLGMKTKKHMASMVSFMLLNESSFHLENIFIRNLTILFEMSFHMESHFVSKWAISPF